MISKVTQIVAVVGLTIIPGMPQQQENPNASHGQAVLHITARVVPAVRTPKKADRAEDIEPIKYSFSPDFQQLSVIEEIRQTTLMVDGHPTKCILKTITIVPK